MVTRSGVTSLAELLLVTWLFAAILAGVAGFAHHQNGLAALQRDRIRLEESLRTGRVVLGAELRFLAPGDVAAVGPDSLRIRAFRGGGPTCGVEAAGSIHVLYRGVRQPDASKDSLILVTPHAGIPTRLVSSSASHECGGSTRMTLDPEPPPDVTYALVFETGAYSVTSGAIRYRRGGGGRQPLTEVLFRDMAIEPAPGGVRVRLAVDHDSLPRLAGHASSFEALILNGAAIP
jgi:hypothetical protein